MPKFVWPMISEQAAADRGRRQDGRGAGRLPRAGRAVPGTPSRPGPLRRARPRADRRPRRSRARPPPRAARRATRRRRDARRHRRPGPRPGRGRTRAAGRGDHPPGPEQAGGLDGDLSDRAARPQHEDRLALAQAAALGERQPAGEAGDAEGDRLGRIESGGDRDQGRRIDQDALREARRRAGWSPSK